MVYLSQDSVSIVTKMSINDIFWKIDEYYFEHFFF